MHKTALRLLKTILPLLLLAYFVRTYIDADTFFTLVGSTSALPVIAYFGSLLAARWLQAVQTRIALFENGVPVGPAEVFRAQLVATYYTMFVPGDLVGGGVTWYLLKQTRGNGAAIAMVLVYLRLLFLATAIPFVIFGLLMESRLHSGYLFAALAVASVATLLATLPLVFRSAARQSASLLDAISAQIGPRIPKAHRMLATVREAITNCASTSSRATIVILAMAVLLHLLGAVGLWLAAEAAHAYVPIHAFFWIWPLMIVVHMLPISFGGLGVREITLIYVLNTLYSTSGESVLLLSMIAFIATSAFSLAGGVWNALHSARPDEKPG